MNAFLGFVLSESRVLNTTSLIGIIRPKRGFSDAIPSGFSVAGLPARRRAAAAG